MIKYLKNELKHIPFILAVIILLYGMVTFATTYLDADQVEYDNSTNSTLPDDVQGAIDNVFLHATDRNSIITRIDSANGIIGGSTLTTTAQDITGAINELQDQVTTLNGFKVKLVGSFKLNVSKAFTIPSLSRHLIYITGLVSNYKALYTLSCTSAGAVYISPVSTTNFTATTATNKVTFSTSTTSTSTVYVYDLCMYGDFLS